MSNARGEAMSPHESTKPPQANPDEVVCPTCKGECLARSPHNPEEQLDEPCEECAGAGVAIKE